MSDQVQVGHSENAEPDDEPPVDSLAVPGPMAPARKRGSSLTRWLLYVSVLALGALLGYGAHLLLKSDDAAEASVLVTPLIGNPYSPTSANLANMDTEARLVTADEVFTDAASAMESPKSAEDLASATSARVVTGSQVINIGFSDSSEADAREGAKAVGQAYLGQRTARAESTLAQQTSAIKEAIKAAQDDLDKAVRAVNKAKVGSTNRQLAQQALNVASATLATRTDELSALGAVSIDPGQIIALSSESSESPAWPWALVGLAVGLLVVLSLHASLRPRHSADGQR